jgi:hypothetical protein
MKHGEGEEGVKQWQCAADNSPPSTGEIMNKRSKASIPHITS